MCVASVENNGSRPAHNTELRLLLPQTCAFVLRPSSRRMHMSGAQAVAHRTVRCVRVYSAASQVPPRVIVS